jgi:predicted DNA-binding transcriptional regulator YafY
MANINDRNRLQLRIAQQEEKEVVFSYCAKSDGHERVVVGSVVDVSESHVTLLDRVRGAYRVFILDRVRGNVLRLNS